MLLIVNLSFSTEFFPANLKTANIIPILMKNDHTSSKNYCLILLYFEFIARHALRLRYFSHVAHIYSKYADLEMDLCEKMFRNPTN